MCVSGTVDAAAVERRRAGAWQALADEGLDLEERLLDV
jgi:hypothetical protein